jgi:hypothetical protein
MEPGAAGCSRSLPGFSAMIGSTSRNRYKMGGHFRNQLEMIVSRDDGHSLLDCMSGDPVIWVWKRAAGAFQVRADSRVDRGIGQARHEYVERAEEFTRLQESGRRDLRQDLSIKKFSGDMGADYRREKTEGQLFDLL